MKQLRRLLQHAKIFCVWVLVGCVCLAWPGNARAQLSYQDLDFPELIFTPPDVERHTLENGMQVVLAEDHELPVIKLYAMMKIGSVYEPEEKIGLATIVAEVMRTGGTTSRSPDEINETLEFLASSVEVDIQDEFGTIELWTLKKNFPTSLAMFADVLRNPVFAQEKVDLAKAQMLEVIRRRNDTPDNILSREFMRLIYGKMHPLARIPQPETIQAITRDDVATFHQTYVHPNTMMLAVTGDFDSAGMLATLQHTFGDWTPQAIDFPDVPDVSSTLTPSVNLIHKEIQQANLMLGHLGILADNPDYAAVRVLDLILGAGGFSNRLYQRVRNDLGLAYVVGSYLGAGFREYGVFMIFCGTRNEAVPEAIQVILDEIRDLREHDVSAEELQAAKNQYLNSFVFKFATVDDIVRRQLFYEYYGYPPDFLETFRERVMQVTSADVRRVAQAYIHPDRLTILAVGDAVSLAQALREFGDVREIPLDPVD